MNPYAIQERTIAELVAQDYRTAEVFKNHGIDFCCGGKKSVAQVCREKCIDEESLYREISTVQNGVVSPLYAFNEWSLTFLTEYIINVHHSYVNKNLGLIGEFASKVAKVHGHHNTETIKIAELWSALVVELTTHMKKEELMLFPYIKNLEKFDTGGRDDLPNGVFETVKSPVAMMEHEHNVAGTLIKEIATLSNNFNPPDYACNTYKVLYAKLKEFQDDLFTHIHLENNILFAKAVKLEEKLQSYL